MPNIPKHIVIATGIYPPEVGGPSQYARELFDTLLSQKYHVSVVTYGGLKRLPTGIRHLCYFFKLLWYSLDADYIIALDTFSVGLPSVCVRIICGARMVVRVGGDFLWESFVERTREKILLSDFYHFPRKWNRKERIIFYITRWVLRSSSAVVFSTEWQKDIMRQPYGLSARRLYVIENFYAPPEEYPLAHALAHDKRTIFLSPSRDTAIKNKDFLFEAWRQVASGRPETSLHTETVSREVLLENMSRARAVIVPSLSEVSPNLVLDAISRGIPAVLTADTGIAERIRDFVVFVNPLSVSDIARGIEDMLNPEIYASLRSAIASRTMSHSWNEIAQEFIGIYESL